MLLGLGRLGPLIVTMAVFALAAGVNTASVALQQRYALLTRWFGRNGWYVHLAVITPPWAWFVALLNGIGGQVQWRLPTGLRPVGIALLAVAAIIWSVAFLQLGPARVGNGVFFNRAPAAPVRGGIFRWLRNPMYDTYALAFFAAGLSQANAVYWALAMESLLLLNRFEATVENKPFEAGGSGPIGEEPPSQSCN